MGTFLQGSPPCPLDRSLRESMGPPERRFLKPSDLPENPKPLSQIYAIYLQGNLAVLRIFVADPVLGSPTFLDGNP